MKEIKDENQFQRGMNHGYILAEHQPDILDGILNGNNKWDDFVQGLAQGRVEYKLDKEQERMNELKNTRDKSKGKSLNKEK